MRSLIVRAVASGVLPITALFALHFLLRGHDEPGGGFVAGLITSAALVLQALAFGFESTARRLAPFLRPAPWIGLGLCVIVALAPMARGVAFLTHDRAEIALRSGATVTVSSTLVFDIGVYLVVVGATATALAVLGGSVRR